MSQTPATQISNPFDTPAASAPASVPQSGASSIHGLSAPADRHSGSRKSGSVLNEKQLPYHGKFKSYRLIGEYERPWLDDKRSRRNKYGNYIVYVFAFIGLAISAYICYDAAAGVVHHDYCLLLDDSFDALDEDVWNREVQTDGFGTGSFDWTTTDDANSFVKDGQLLITPTLTTETTEITVDQILNGYTLNLTTDGTCTNDDYKSCSVRSNSSTGSIIPPVRSARLTTRHKKSITYGKVEVVAKMPRGDWLWPAIWMMPESEKYGEWPRSGEIDLMETRGNKKSSYPGGSELMTTALHWGPSSKFDGYLNTQAAKMFKRVDFAKEFHTFGMEWSKDYLFFYLDSRLQQILYVKFDKKTMWDRGGFSTASNENDTLYTDPWSSTGNLNTPFDQAFYLILNVAVGSNNGWFEDGVGSKPWVDESTTARRDFWEARDKWYSTWGEGEDRSMIIKSVKMWQEGACASK